MTRYRDAVPYPWWHPRRWGSWIRKAYDPTPVVVPRVEGPTSGEALGAVELPWRDRAILTQRRQLRYYRKLIHHMYVGTRDWRWPRYNEYKPSLEELDAAGRHAVRVLRRTREVEEGREALLRAVADVGRIGVPPYPRIPCEGRPHG